MVGVVAVLLFASVHQVLAWSFLPKQIQKQLTVYLDILVLNHSPLLPVF